MTVSTELFKALLDTFGPFVLLASALVYIIVTRPRPATKDEKSSAFSDAQKLWLLEEIRDPIFERIDRAGK